LIAGKYKDVTAAVFETRLGSRFVFNKHIAALMGINDFSAKINIDKEDVRTEVNYGFDGVFAGIDLRF
jgi:hypothetical protein